MGEVKRLRCYEEEKSAGVGNTWQGPSSFKIDARIHLDFILNTYQDCAISIQVMSRTMSGWPQSLCTSVGICIEGDARLKCYPLVFTTVHACVLSCLCEDYICVSAWMSALSQRKTRRRVGWKWREGGVSCSIWSLTCCCALLRPPCLEVSSAGIGRLHASSIRGSILLLPCRLLSWGLLNWA